MTKEEVIKIVEEVLKRKEGLNHTPEQVTVPFPKNAYEGIVHRLELLGQLVGHEARDLRSLLKKVEADLS